MATTSSFGFRRLKAVCAAIATTAALSTVSSLTPAVAAEPEQLNVKELLSSDNPSIADLAGTIAQIEERIAEAEATIGSQREAVNRALVDLNDARTRAEQARRGTTTARQQLDTAEDEVAQAQAKLDDISRSAYRRANTSDAVSQAAGKNARADMLERQSFLRSQSDKQQDVLTRLEQERTQKANKESQLRKTQKLAEQRENQASEAEADARQLLAESESTIEDSTAERTDLLTQLEELQKTLDKVKGVDASDESSLETGSNVQSQSLTEEDLPTSEGSNLSAEELPEAEEPSAVSEAETSGATTSDAASVQGPSAEEARNRSLQAQRTSPTMSPEEMKELSSAADTLSSDPNVKELSSKSEDRRNTSGGSSLDSRSIDPETIALGIGVVGTVASMVAASQPGHSNSLTAEEIDALAQGSSKLFALQGEDSATSTHTASQDSSTTSTSTTTSGVLDDDDEDGDALASDLSGLLEDLETTDSVTDKAASKLGGASREAQIETVIARATSQVGVPYAWGGGDANGPTQGIRDGGVADSHGDYNKVGFDCSGLVLYAFAGVGISLPHYTGYQYQKGEKISTSDIERGDLIFYGPSGNQHVAIYLGDGTMVEAPQSGQNVSIAPVRQAGMAPYAVRLI
ncbi:DIP1281 family NlpC/P60 protein [Corynebacterium minutissimum]|uniref:Cell wall-associated hydrolase n=1 Tax=Corynebacterium minutissimum TaxID=38301 RepID=A0A376CY71_9CORY|nr:NlpC/P60 family protein [Corynebacterium minutissimum]QRP60985.1 C40 family peptidase [Corynebacterium minutissimum]STC77997.1 cell wall-associated hydrolase [Corynebacterium minutissimum]